MNVLTPRAFWGIFVSAWALYGGLFYSVALTQGEGVGLALLGSLGAVIGPGVPALYLALNRRKLLRPARSAARFMAHKVLVGLGFTVAACTITASYVYLTPVSPFGELGPRPAAIAASWGINALFLYALLLGFLMWADSFERIEESRMLAAREAMLRAQAEAKAIRAQFNPHFVFNTLHSLMLLVRADPDTAERAIEDVAELIRYASTLQKREIDQVTMAKELEFARRYVALESLRLGDRLAVEWRVEPELEGILVPAFSLQTLLENAIKHGIAPKPEGGTVRIRASRTGEQVELSVEDDGLGAHSADVGANGGSGLRLLSQRLGVVHGDGASLEWSTEPGSGFSAVVRVPAREADRP
jgi:signal transduction histidine kinase